MLALVFLLPSPHPRVCYKVVFALPCCVTGGLSPASAHLFWFPLWFHDLGAAITATALNSQWSSAHGNSRGGQTFVITDIPLLFFMKKNHCSVALHFLGSRCGFCHGHQENFTEVIAIIEIDPKRFLLLSLHCALALFPFVVQDLWRVVQTVIRRCLFS